MPVVRYHQLFCCKYMNSAPTHSAPRSVCFGIHTDNFHLVYGIYPKIKFCPLYLLCGVARKIGVYGFACACLNVVLFVCIAMDGNQAAAIATAAAVDLQTLRYITDPHTWTNSTHIHVHRYNMFIVCQARGSQCVCSEDS